MIKIKNVESGKTELWTMDQVLEEINRDRSDGWTPYNEFDWVEGWNEWVSREFYDKVQND